MPDVNQFNLFELLDLNPSAIWDAQLFERRLGEKQAEWSGLTNHPKRGMEARLNLELVPRLREVAVDPQLRATHAALAAAAAQARRESELQKLEGALAVLQAKGHVLDSELADLVRKFAAVMPEAELVRRLRVPVVQDPYGRDDAPPEELDTLTAGRLRGLLAMVQKRDLYDFLGLAFGSSLAELRARADEIYERSQKSAARDLANTARAQLAGQCRALLGTQAGKARYDATLQNARYEPLRELADVAAARTRRLPAATIEALLQQFLGARAEPGEVERARAVLRGHALRKGYALEMPMPPPVPNPTPSPTPFSQPTADASGVGLPPKYMAAGIAGVVLVGLTGVIELWPRGPSTPDPVDSAQRVRRQSPPPGRASASAHSRVGGDEGGVVALPPGQRSEAEPPSQGSAAAAGRRPGAPVVNDDDDDDGEEGALSGLPRDRGSSSSASALAHHKPNSRARAVPPTSPGPEDHSQDNCDLPDGKSMHTDSAAECQINDGTPRD
jgi:hypothetical protein